MQEIIASILLIAAVGFLVKKYFFKTSAKGNCSSDCNCG
ncbi:MAG: FeoB-associated Cys-rich membrane protein [Flavobacteriaceae bacterium]|nr:FeoB-associated Cys-rich membrane protein [Flavobacteriaceae bacterium]